MQFGDMVLSRTGAYIRPAQRSDNLARLYLYKVYYCCQRSSLWFLFLFPNLYFFPMCLNFSMNYLNWDMQFMLGLAAAARYLATFRFFRLNFTSFLQLRLDTI